MSAIYITPDGEKVEITPMNHKSFTLKEAQKLVGGFVELLRLPNDRLMLLNEHGKLEGLPENVIATALAHHVRVIDQSDRICGAVILCDVLQFT